MPEDWAAGADVWFVGVALVMVGYRRLHLVAGDGAIHEGIRVTARRAAILRISQLIPIIYALVGHVTLSADEAPVFAPDVGFRSGFAGT